ncbi:MAG TPA: glycerol-3-phosphate dehydrogenase, partial [Clostridia bacterium]|nr:glycerol-3-phosphate dehydrogenase [Clostridia bacterium]
MKTTVLGCGRWGSFLAWYANKIGHKVFLWGQPDSKNLNELIKTRQNNFLALDEDIIISSDLEQALDFSNCILISISSQNLRNLMVNISKYDLSGKTIVLCMKGLEESTGKRLSEVVAEYVPCTTQIAIWVGPGHVQDFINGIPNCMVIDCHCEKTKKKLVRRFSSSLIRFYYGSDMIGNELGAATKNIIGIA